MKEPKFYVCKHCGNITGAINDSGVPMVCCGDKMSLMEANQSDGAHEKHVPVVEVSGDTVNVKVGDTAHPMTEEHSITWVYLSTEKGGQRKNIHAGEAPEAVFKVVDDKPLEVYSYCNLHGLWKAKI